jgi:ATP-dependent Clp protease ATP-binding subunit ClpA
MRGSFDRFSVSARNSLTLAQTEAERLRQPYIAPEHMLLALAADPLNTASRLLLKMGVELGDVAATLEKRIAPGKAVTAGDIGLTPKAKKVIELAVDEARRLGHHHIGTEHLLLGLMREGKQPAAAVLKDMGVELERTRAELVRMSVTEEPNRIGGSTVRTAVADDLPFELFTDRARTVLKLAQDEAQRFNHNYIGTEHLLLGLVREGEGVAARVLSNLGIDILKVRSAVEFIIGRGERQVSGEIGLTPRAKKVVELAGDEGRRLGHH